jgi:hypothetical protein
MASHTTNYHDTFITVAPDSSAPGGIEPPARASVAARTYELIAGAPYDHTSDEVIFTVWAERHDVPAAERDAAREEFFSVPHACLRASDLGKRYGWGFHHDADGRVALIAVHSPEYEHLASGVDPNGRRLKVIPAMRSSRRT